MLRPKLKPFSSKEDALAAASEMETEFSSRRGKQMILYSEAGGHDVTVETLIIYST